MSMEDKGLPTVALVGSPNSGKTTIFNQLTSSNYKTGNWAGVTVEKVEGKFRLNKEANTFAKIIDLPGCTSILSSDGNSPDELVVKNYLEEKQADLAISILDSTNLEHGLYQCIQLSIMEIPYIVVCNMSDIAYVRGITIREGELSKLLGVPVISTSAVNKSSLVVLKEAIDQALFAVSRNKLKPKYIDLDGIKHLVFDEHTKLRALSLKDIIRVNDFIYKLSSEYVVKSVVKDKNKEDVTFLQDKIDRLVLHKYLGLPIFVAIMYLMFFLALTIGNGILVPGLGELANIPFVDIPTWILQSIHAPDIIITIVADGVGTAVATLFSFVPVVGLVYLFMSILEASGYMVRASIVVDRFLSLIGLTGSMFLPLVVGLGCNIATIASSRTLPNHAEKQATILMAPFMSCSARLPVYALFCSAFLPEYSAIVVFAMYMMGIVLAVFTGVVVKETFLKDKKSPLILRMPNYLRPQWKMISKITFNNIKSFLNRLKGMFLILVTLVGVLGAVNTKGDVNINIKDSILADISKKVTVLLYPIGFTDKDWQATVGLLSGAVAKETIVGTMTSIYAQSDSNSSNTREKINLISTVKDELIATKDIFIDGIKSSFNYNIDSNADNEDIKIIKNNAIRFNDTYLTLGFLLFILSYFPCFATLSIARKEGGIKIALFSGIWSLTLAYVTSGTFFCLTHISTISTTRLFTELVILWGVLVIEILMMKIMSNRTSNKLKKVVF